MENNFSSSIILVLAIVILIAWGLAFSLKDQGIGNIIAVIAVVVTVVWLIEFIGSLNKKHRYDSINR